MVNISLNGQKPIGSVGIEYILRLVNVYSDSTTGYLGLNQGAGSYIVLALNAKDLSDVYVWPNPFKYQSREAIVFANLPRNAQITIWSIDGTKIGEIEGIGIPSGGIEFYPKDLNGNSLPTGIYIYRVVMLDDSKNEQEEKLGKFAVIK